MKHSNKKIGISALSQIEMREQILRSLIASFKIEGIEISDQSANEILHKVAAKLK